MACASRRARSPDLPSRGTILTATSRPLCSSRASQTDPEPPLPSGRSGRYRPRRRFGSGRGARASDMVRNSYAAAGQTPFRSDRLVTVKALSTRDDEFEFDFFDEPDEETVTQRRRAVRAEPRPKRGPRRPRGPAGPPAGLTPILRLVGLIAAAIVVVVLVVFWIQGCQSDAKTRAYRNYMA